MSELIAARASGELLDRFEEEKESLGEDEPESELIRDILDRGLRERRVPLGVRLDLPNRVAARIEDEREPGEAEEEVVRRFLREVVEDGVVARRGDALDALDAGDPLRATVEDAREDGEPLDDATRRLIRQGATASPSESDGAFERAVGGAFGAAIAVVAASSLVGVVGALAVVVVVLGVATYLATTAIAAEFRASVGSRHQSHVE